MDWITFLAICVIVLPWYGLLYAWTYIVVTVVPRRMLKKQTLFDINTVMKIPAIKSLITLISHDLALYCE